MRQQSSNTAARQYSKTATQPDNNTISSKATTQKEKTTRQKDSKTAGQQDNKTTTQQPNNVVRRNARSDPPPLAGVLDHLLSRRLRPLVYGPEAVLEPSYKSSQAALTFRRAAPPGSPLSRTEPFLSHFLYFFRTPKIIKNSSPGQTTFLSNCGDF